MCLVGAWVLEHVSVARRLPAFSMPLALDHACGVIKKATSASNYCHCLPLAQLGNKITFFARHISQFHNQDGQGETPTSVETSPSQCHETSTVSSYDVGLQILGFRIGHMQPTKASPNSVRCRKYAYSNHSMRQDSAGSIQCTLRPSSIHYHRAPRL
ncbi:hypothetical protein BABINDRAFT_83132 [Babjeviella inositovora NRRL Y-12698]|uniref:Uncharacterized protein n=1 Tax=Babjeviella inositovora NRRL Y-12698 TaxID=984486 RepID=A0A1E3QN08_9ASCO|nr:uncharacterized protein BABINDRAFT_83132 [Babjeviella inositovora NRRL Y-12698]ODQ78377.1 hypothetical protein BABINDRAFT_83132 [Babjeviella inositovora NRRL Y-12698]